MRHSRSAVAIRDHSASRLSVASRLGCLLIPIARIAQVAFGTMQVCVHPGARAVVDVLGNPVSLVPIAVGGMPHRSQNGRDGRWIGVSQCGSEFVDGHTYVQLEPDQTL